MEKVSAVAQVVAPIFAAVLIGIFAKRRQMIHADAVKGMQQYVMSFGLPCVIFNSCLGASINAQSLVSFVMVLPIMLMASLTAFFVLKKRFPYHNMPMIFAAQESGMLGIPLYLTLFGTAHLFKIGVLDLAQAITCIPMIAILSADMGDNPKPMNILVQVLRSPILIMAVLGLLLNLSGVKDTVLGMGVVPVLSEVAAFISQPVSALMLFSVGYNLSISSGNRDGILRLSVIHFVMFAVAGLLMQGILCLLPQVEAETRWAILLYSTLPGSYISTTLGRTQEEAEFASGVCSVLTIVSLLVFCGIAVCVV